MVVFEGEITVNFVSSVTDNTNLLNLTETKFYEMGLMLPCLFSFL